MKCCELEVESLIAVLLIVAVHWVIPPAPGVQDRLLFVACAEDCFACRWSNAVLCVGYKGPRAGVHPVEQHFSEPEADWLNAIAGEVEAGVLVA